MFTQLHNTIKRTSSPITDINLGLGMGLHNRATRNYDLLLFFNQIHTHHLCIQLPQTCYRETIPNIRIEMMAFLMDCNKIFV